MFKKVLKYAATYSYFTDKSINSMLEMFLEEEAKKIEQHKNFVKTDESELQHKIVLKNAELLEDVIHGYEPELFEFFLHGNGFIMPLQGTKYVEGRDSKKECYHISGPLFVECEKDSTEIVRFKYREAMFKLGGQPGINFSIGINKHPKEPEFVQLVYVPDAESIILQPQKIAGTNEKPVFEPEGEPRFTFFLSTEPYQK